MSFDEISLNSKLDKRDSLNVNPKHSVETTRTNESIMSNPITENLSEGEKLSILQPSLDENKLTYDDLDILYRRCCSVTEHPYEYLEKERKTPIKHFTNWLLKDVLGFGSVSKQQIYDANEEIAGRFAISNLAKYTSEKTEYNEAAIKKYIKDTYNIEPTDENLRAVINGDIDPSNKAVDLAKKSYEETNLFYEGLADLTSGMASYFAYSTMMGRGTKAGKLGTLLSLGVAALVGGIGKVFVKGVEGAAVEGYQELIADNEYDKYKYSTETLGGNGDGWYDLATGAFSGILTPITGGLGGAFGKVVAKKLGLKVLERGGEQVVKKGFGNILKNYAGYSYEGGSKAMIAAAVGTEMVVDGSVGGAVDCAFRTAYEGGDAKEIGQSALQGGIIGAAFSPVIGGMFRALSRGFCFENTSPLSEGIIKIRRMFDITFCGRTKAEKKVLRDIPVCHYDYSLIRKLYKDEKFSPKEIENICNRLTNSKEHTKAVEDLIYGENFDLPFYVRKDIALRIDKNNCEFAQKLCKSYKEMEIPENKIACIVENYGKISIKEFQNLQKVIGLKNIAKLTNSDILVACKVVNLYGKTNINEIPIAGKKEALRALVACNEGLFRISDEMKKMFPLLPTDRETYCSLLPSMVRSLGIETNILTPQQVSKFNKELFDLSATLAKLSDADFSKMKITQTYSKDSFIERVLDIVKELKPSERQKVYDYFGFELHRSKGTLTGFRIAGYPVNLNNGKKLAQITDLKTKEVVELLRPEVVKFSSGNRVKCDNPQVEKLLNTLLEALPELRAQIGKAQHTSHDFDILQHSLKVMQKVSQDVKFKDLNESDKKIMMIASLLHDITKIEGKVSKLHASESALDAFFIAKKFNLTKEEEIKLYSLIKHHEWLEYVNMAKSQHELTKRLQSVAYDLQNDNLFEMSLMFTHADLKGVKADDVFHDTTLGKGRVTFDGKVRSYGSSADEYAKRIREYVEELQKSQPLLPVTKMPLASRIAEKITVVNADGSTNIKGVYKDKDGLVVIKFNEVEDWELIGFPKGSVSKGIEAKKGVNYGDSELEENVNTGNIKFFVHGLDYENQLTKFDAFSLVDSDVLLSISYTERPESKFRFFRTQGVILDFDTKYIHGGGNTDVGSGCGKSISDFKKEYIFGGFREKDRWYVSKLIKKATGMNDNEYVQFVKKYKNKPLSEIEPAETREKIIQAFASINSNKRKGNRSYNEMYGSNPNRVMGVFAYSADNFVGNPIAFINEKAKSRTDFLKRYAMEHDIPFIVFGD